MFLALLYSACTEETTTSHDAHNHGKEETGSHPHSNPDWTLTDDDIEVTSTMQDEIDDYLDLLAYGLIDLTVDADFISLLNEQIELQFDGDDNVLFKDLVAACTLAEINLETEMRASILAHAPQAIQDKVDDLGDILDHIDYSGKGFYPQVYIPAYTTTNHTNRPVVIPAKGDLSEVVSLSGYSATVDASGEVTGYGTNSYNEDDSETQPQWVISINDRVNLFGELGGVYYKKKTDNCTPTKWFEFYDQIKFIKDKDVWPSGANDVAFVFVQYEDLGSSVTTTSSGDQTFWGENSIDDDELNQWKDIHLEFTANWCTDDPSMALVIYEKDYNAPRKTWWFHSTKGLRYRSYQGAYWTGYFDEADYVSTGPWQGTQTSHSNSEIAFEMRGREN